MAEVKLDSVTKVFPGGARAVDALSLPVHPLSATGSNQPSNQRQREAPTRSPDIVVGVDGSAYSALDSAAEAWRDKYPQIEVDVATVNAEAARVLADMSRHAQLVVVGAHGYGDSAGQLGSVPMRLLHRSHCPVLVTH